VQIWEDTVPKMSKNGKIEANWGMEKTEAGFIMNEKKKVVLPGCRFDDDAFEKVAGETSHPHLLLVHLPSHFRLQESAFLEPI